MKAHDIRALLSTPPAFEEPEGERGGAVFWVPQGFNTGMLWVGRWSGTSPWERHADTDELLHVLEGDVLVTVLTDDGPVETRVGAGALFVVPKGHWHRQSSEGTVLQCGVTPGPTEHSEADDPRAQD